MFMTRKNAFSYTAIALITAITFLWNQCVWAIGLETLHNYPFDNSQQHVVADKLKYEENLPQNLQEISLKLFGRFLAIPTEKSNFEAKFAYIGAENTIQTCVIPSDNDRLGRAYKKEGTINGKKYKYEVITYDAVGRPTYYKEVHSKATYKHYGIIYDSIGRVTEEYVKVSAKSGTGPWKSKTKILTYYKYEYDIHGNRTTAYEHEIYRKTSTNPLGTIIKAIVSIIIIAATWGAATPYVAAAWMAASNFVFSVLSGADIGQALLGAVISFVAAYIGAELGAFLGGGTSAATDAATSFLKDGGMTIFFQALSLADSLMVDDQGRGLFEQLFGKWGSFIFEAITVLGGLMAGGKGTTGPPYHLYAALGRLAVSAILTALGDRINPYLRQFISAFTTSFLNAWANAKTAAYNEEQKAKFEQSMRDQGFLPEIDETTGEQIWVNDQDISNTTILNADGTLNSIIIKDEYGNSAYSLTPSKNIPGGLEYRDTQGNFLYTTAINSGGGIDYYDANDVKRLSLYSTGWTEVFDSVGKSYALIPPDAEIVWNEDGTIKESFIEYDNYTEYYNKDGSLNGRIVDGYTALRRGDEIIGQYKDVIPSSETESIYIYRDASGRFVNKVTIADGGILANNGQQTTYFSNSNTPVWTRANYEHSDIYFYDSAGQNIIEILSTQLDESGLVKGYLYTDTLTGNITKYDAEGNYEGFYLTRKDEQGNIIGYQGTDKEGNFTVLDRRGNILAKQDSNGIITVYDTDPTKISLILNPDTIHTVTIDDQIKFVLGYDVQGDKMILYDTMGNVITDNPVGITLKLGDETITGLPDYIQDELAYEYQSYIGSILPKGEVTGVSSDGDTLLIWTDGFDTKFYDITGKLLFQDHANNIAHPLLYLANNNRLPGEATIVFTSWTGVEGVEVNRDALGRLVIKDAYTRYRERDGLWEIDRKLSTGEWVRTYSDGRSIILNPTQIGNYDRLGNQIEKESWITVFGKIWSKNKTSIEYRERFENEFKKGELGFYELPKPELPNTPTLKSNEPSTFMSDGISTLFGTGEKLLYSFPYVDTKGVFLDMVLRGMEDGGTPAEPTFKEGVTLVQGNNLISLSELEINKFATTVDAGFSVLNRLNAAFDKEAVDASMQNYSYLISVWNIDGVDKIRVYKMGEYQRPNAGGYGGYGYKPSGQFIPDSYPLPRDTAEDIVGRAFPDLDRRY